MQFECHQKPEMLERKRKDGAVIAGTSIFSALFFMIAIYYLKQISAINKVNWDVETVTAGDYAVEIEVIEFFKIFKEKELHKYQGDSIGIAFEKFLVKEIEDLLT